MGPHGQSGRLRKISPPPGFSPRTVQPVASRYTDYATWHTIYVIICDKCETLTNFMLLKLKDVKLIINKFLCM